LADVDVLITDVRPPKDLENALRDADVRVIVAE
jgi:DeoR/GlpR family transcriptional regulator of sugar metabolism